MTSDTDQHPRVLVSAFQDGELSPAETALVQAHLAECASCRTLLEDFRAIAASTASETAPPIPADLRLLIRRRLGAAAGADMPRPWFGLRSYRFGLAAAAGVVLVIGLWILRQENVPGHRSVPAGSRPTTEGRLPAPPGKGTGDLSIPNIPRNEAGESAKRPGATDNSGGAARAEDRQVPSAAPAREGEAPLVVLEKVMPERVGPPAGKEASHPPATPPIAANQVARAHGASAPVAQRGVSPSPFSGPDAAGARPVPQGAAPPLQEFTRGRILLFEFPGYTVSLSEDGTLALSSGEYACTVRPGPPAPDPEVPLLFTLASGPDLGDSGPVSARTTPSASTTGAITLKDERGSALRLTGQGSSGGITESAAIDMEARLRALLKNRYIGLLEDRCGPAPQAVHSR